VVPASYEAETCTVRYGINNSTARS